MLRGKDAASVGSSSPALTRNSAAGDQDDTNEDFVSTGGKKRSRDNSSTAGMDRIAEILAAKEEREAVIATAELDVRREELDFKRRKLDFDERRQQSLNETERLLKSIEVKERELAMEERRLKLQMEEKEKLAQAEEKKLRLQMEEREKLQQAEEKKLSAQISLKTLEMMSALAAKFQQ